MRLTTPTTGHLVWRLSLKWRAAVDRTVKPLGLTQAQYSLLATLTGLVRRGVRPSQRELADHMGLEPLHVSKLARALEQAGLLTRPPDPDDPRAVRLDLTERGHEVITEAIKLVRDLHEDLTANIGGPRSDGTRRFRATLQTLLGDQPTGGEEAMTTARPVGGRDLNLAAAAARSLLTTLLDREGLDFTDYVVLRTVADQSRSADALISAITASAIASPDTARSVITKLTEAGHLTADGGLVDVTPGTRELVERLTTDSTRAGDQLFAGIAPEDLDAAKRVLDTITARAAEVRATL
ncbi:MarR family winged helix-turn-helix transcriptional regulator [Amycolatopsis sp. FDAARGOS 1241]|uniref:MarR family winged helix-turn-helix transcriptional regulator n=1 Tax=Amycolatopsis sp. FDAARGOS 1241 TaxID=2778070 RepID=UPI00194F4309|nr:MarR family transcriptional regulator [Amycolatopsis sp. FDAARGOS 1241]QRP43718.1 winged helix DNA-binding protein [Amycolatopsis sp. FDAARGOS 1241]